MKKNIIIDKNQRKVEFTNDDIGVLIEYESRIFRLINPKMENYVHELFDCGLMNELIDLKLFVNSWIAKDVECEGYNLIVEHQKIEHWNYPYEWSFNMLKDASLTVIDANKICNKYGYELFDVHSYNVVFNFSIPQYVDLGSIVKVDKKNGKSWSGYLIFNDYFYMPLYLFTKGFSSLSQAISLLNGEFEPYDLFKLRYKYSSFFGNGFQKLIFKGYYNLRRLSVTRHFKLEAKLGKHKYYTYILRVKNLFQNRFTVKRANKQINKLKKARFDTYWDNYHTGFDLESNKRVNRIVALINNYCADATSIVEIGSNQGKIATHILKHTHIEKIIATDYDKNAINKLYLDEKNSNNILSLVYDFLRPSGKIGLSTIENRIKSDLVIGLAVTHHFLLSQNMSLKDILKKFKKITKKYIIIEFMPLGLYGGEDKPTPPIPSYYNTEWFRDAFEVEFINILDEKLEKNRHVFVGEIKNKK